MSRAEFDMDSEDDLLEVDLDELLASLEFETTVPTEREAAAVAVAIATHRTDRALAAADAAADDEPETVPGWKLDGRLRSNGVTHRRRPRNVERGSEWRAASRSL
ncbi:hypothetical protein [Halorientalis pallida]|uniref:Uncharacterized protein n=1 Tax=Halorientalis pallida TaxID=2479928 RepID=A0A498L3Z4_9EURY|nr:hypothetical protein [Halorientalis pallida]RXK49012.1 hypothetical protein EAF64_08755 [Halorientalis pallida]